jgi:dynein heavy chain
MLKLFNEVWYWGRLNYECPHYVATLYKKAETVRVMRENVMLVVNDYNR